MVKLRFYWSHEQLAHVGMLRLQPLDFNFIESCFAQVTGLVDPGEHHQALGYGEYSQAGSTSVQGVKWSSAKLRIQHQSSSSKDSGSLFQQNCRASWWVSVSQGGTYLLV